MAEPPVRIDTFDVTDETDFAGLVHGALNNEGGYGWFPSWNAPVDWVFHAYKHVASTWVADRISRGVATNLTAPEPNVRAQALIFFERYPVALGSDRITELVAGNRRGFAGVTNPYHTDFDLEYSLLWAFIVRLQHEPGEYEVGLARAQILRPGGAHPLTRGLITVDAAWVDEHAEQIVRGTPSAGALVVVGLSEEGYDVMAIARRVMPLCRGDEAVEYDLSRLVDNPDLRQAILAAFSDAPL